MPTFEGCIEAKEISLCPVNRGGGANQRAHVLMRKSQGVPPEVKPENTPMPTPAELEKAAADRQAEIQKAARAVANKIAGMSDVTKAHYLALPDDAQDAFLAKSAEDMAAEATAAAAAVEKARLEAEAAKSGTTVEYQELKKGFEAQAETIKTLLAGQADRDIEKRADNEFKGFPGGTTAAVAMLKSFSALPEDSRKAAEDLMKAQCAAAVKSMAALGGRSELDLSKQASAQQRLDAAAETYAAEKKVTKSVALEKVSEMAEHAADVAALNG